MDEHCPQAVETGQKCTRAGAEHVVVLVAVQILGAAVLEDDLNRVFHGAETPVM